MLFFLLSSELMWPSYILHSSELIYFWHDRYQIWLCSVSELEARKHLAIERRDVLELVESWTRVIRFNIGQCLHGMGISSLPSACPASLTSGVLGVLLTRALAQALVQIQSLEKRECCSSDSVVLNLSCNLGVRELVCGLILRRTKPAIYSLYVIQRAVGTSQPPQKFG